MPITSKALADLKRAFGEIAVLEVGARLLVRITSAPLPRGCSPEHTSVLLLFEGEEARPQTYVSPGILVPNGTVPRSTSTVLIEGESWMQFSYQFAWDENKDSLEQFVLTALGRFAKNE